MCAIAGVLDLAGRPVPPEPLRALCDRMRHRGPDGAGVYLGDGVALGHRRLAIVDRATGGQPMSNEDGTVWVTLNGQIYNFRELRSEMEARGHRFRTASDTEVVAHAYEEEGAACVHRFRGMFALAVWDARTRTLLLARDRAGKKPLFYTRAEGRLVFASELQSLVRFPGVRRAVDARSVDQYLSFGYVPAPHTAFEGVHKLPPAHTLTLRPGSGGEAAVLPEPERYWTLDFAPKLRVDEDEAEERLLGALRESVRLRLPGDLPSGALLSGGLDSSLVLALMAEAGVGPLRTFSAGFQERDFDERAHARRVAERFGAEHHEVVVGPESLARLPELVRHYGEPFADSSALPTWEVARLAAGSVRVVLNGDGGDECMAGYDRYRAALVAERYARLPAAVRQGVIEPLAALVPDALPARSRLRQGKRFVEAATRPLARRYTRWVTYLSDGDKRALYTPGFRERLDGPEGSRWMVELVRSTAAPDAALIDRLLAVDTSSYLPFGLLVKMDIATMASSLEARSPLLDQRVMELCARLPATLKLRQGEGKYLLRRLARRYLPPETVDRRKMGFGVPIARWLRGELRPLLQEALLSPRAADRGYFDPAGLRRLVEEHQSRRRDHASRLWALLWLELWHREFIDPA